MQAKDIRVVGGVDNPNSYRAFDQGGVGPLHSGRLPVPDPYADLPVPTTAADPSNISTTLRGGVQVMQLPFISAPTVLSPGVYEWIDVQSGAAVFQPGVYIIRNVNPSSQIALNIAGGTVVAQGVLFYITNSAGYDPSNGAPDMNDGASIPSGPSSSTTNCSVVINSLTGSSFSPLSDPNSPFNGMIIYQRRLDYRAIAVVAQPLLGGQDFAGAMYAKYGHVIFSGSGTYNTRAVAGTMRLLAVGTITLNPTSLLPPARDVFLVE